MLTTATQVLKSSMEQWNQLNAGLFQTGTSCYSRSVEQWSHLGAGLLQTGTSCYAYSMDEYLKTVRYNVYLFNRMMEAGVIPTMRSFFALERDITDPLLETFRGDRTLADAMEEVSARMQSAGKYQKLVRIFGRQLFGSATFTGETRLAENDFVTLTYIPPKVADESKPALFHVGGFLPYSDRIFRILPEANLFLPFLERGVGVYAMELKGDRHELGDVRVTLPRFIDTVDEMSRIAFSHNIGISRQRKMVLEGYCGLAMPALAFIAAKPKEADERFKLAMTMVAPVDGRECRILAKMVDKVPTHLFITQFTMSELLGGSYIDGDSMRLGMDIPLGSFFPKSPFGRFMRGWKLKELSSIDKIEDLDAGQRRELAGAYWISPENCKRFPMPVDLSRFATGLWLDGVEDDLRIPYVYKGRQLNLRTILDETKINVVGCYGGQDMVVPNQTAKPLIEGMGDRYTHVVHPEAGHISYVLSPEVWSKDHPKALDPNPIDLILEHYTQNAKAKGGE